MKVLAAIPLFVFILIFSSFYEPGNSDKAAAVVSGFYPQVKNLLDAVELLKSSGERLTSDSLTAIEARKQFSECRLRYKQMEWWVEYYNPHIAHQLNEAAVLEVDEKDLEYTAATGFQVIEGLLWTDDAFATKQALLQEIDLLKTNIEGLGFTALTLKTTDSHIWAAARTELARIITLGITGFDTPASETAIAEAAASLKAVRNGMQTYLSGNNPLHRQWTETLNAAIGYLSSYPGFAQPDRLEFITQYYVPISRLQLQVQEQLEIPITQLNSSWYPGIPAALNLQAKHIFEPDAIDLFFYTNHTLVYENYQYRYQKTGNADHIDTARAALGKLLFYDPVLSGNMKRSCASCHQPQLAFTDGLAKSSAFDGLASLGRNTPTLLNAVYNRRQFYDGRAFTVESQIDSVVNSRIELHGNFSNAVKVLRGSKTYRQLFAQVFGQDSDKVITGSAIVAAIAAYERTLTSFNSRFDRYVRGEKDMMSSREKNGFNLFAGKAKCATCHFMPLFNGLVPPDYVKDEFEILGTLTDGNIDTPVLDTADRGRAKLSGIGYQDFAFRTPGLRNVALTAPYMHNGGFKTLEEVVRFYNKGGAAGLGIALENQTLSPQPLNLSEAEIGDLVAFMGCLTDTANLTSKPAALPAFKNKKLNARKVGGEY